MALTPGTRLGVYEVTEQIGEGGMGQVYRATDTKLKRQVALKILPASVAAEADRLARFQREAEVLASLNHPHIAAIYGLEESGGVSALVMELVEGEDLSQRIARGAIPIDEALPIATQIAEALEAAHEQSIIHRDLKPANIKLRADGSVKVLDFGLAKAMEPAAGSFPNLSLSPTLSMHATQAGIILGTAAYMSPEQARGRLVDKRADIWAFGSVLFEMLTSHRAFPGEDLTDTIVSVVSKEPDWTALPAATPPSLRRLLARCLKKDPKARMRDIGEVRVQLEELVTGAPEEMVAAVIVPSAPVARPLWKRAFPWIATAVVAGAFGAGAVAYLLRPTTPAVVRFFINPPDKASFISGGRPGASAAISPDGRRIVFTVRDGSHQVSLWIRGIDALTALPVPGTEDAAFPFWSPDSKWIAYFAHDKLIKVAAEGGSPQTVCDAVGGRGGAWNRDGVILFGANGVDSGGARVGPLDTSPLSRVSSAGGKAVAATRVDGTGDHRFPSFLPDGRHFVFYRINGGPNLDGIYIGSLDDTASHRLIDAETSAIYSSGHLLFVRQSTLFAQPFDLKTLRTSGEPVPLAERVTRNFGGVLAFSVSNNGALAYGIGPTTSTNGPMVQLTWIDRQGKAMETVGPPGTYRGIDLSPDGKRIAAHRHEGAGGDIWIIDGTHVERLTFDASVEHEAPVWSPDGQWIAYGTVQSGKNAIYRKRSNGSAAEELLLETQGAPARPVDWAPDGQSIVYDTIGNRGDLFTLPLAGDRKPVPAVNTQANESNGQISPDGKWLAYQSSPVGRPDLYVRPFLGGTGTYQVSVAGGAYPRWRADGRELFYLDVPSPAQHGQLMAVDVETVGGSFHRGAPHALFDSGTLTSQHPPGGSYHAYVVSRDGQRFLMPRPVESSTFDDASTAPIAVVLNWAQSLQD